MAEIPNNTFEMIDRIYAAIEKKELQKFRLTRLGASSIGTECSRAVWYAWRAFIKPKFNGRMLRLFRTGHLQEDRIVDDLKVAGFSVWEVDPDTNEQWTYTDTTGHFVAKLDGVIKGVVGAEKTPHTLEIKTHSKKSFDEVCKAGVIRAKPVHFAQMLAGMYLSGLRRGLYVALCKDNEQYYIERIAFDASAAAKLGEKIGKIISSTLPPERISDKEDYFACKWCDSVGVCKKGEMPIRTCRSCEHVELESEGKWSCGLMKMELTPEAQLKACEHYSVIKG